MRQRGGTDPFCISQPKTEKQQEAIKARLLSREEKKRKQLADLGIEYDFVGLAGQKAEEEQKAEPEAVVKGTPKAKKGRKSAGGDEVRFIRTR